MAEQTFTSGQILTAAQMTTLQSNTGLAWISTTAITGTTFNLDGIFTSTYTNYVITVDNLTSTGNLINMKLRAGGASTSTGYYCAQNYTDWAGVASVQGAVNNGVQWVTNYTAATGNQFVMNIYNPQTASRVTTMTIQATWNALAAGSGGGYQSATTQFDGVSIISASAMTGTISVFGYRK
jgi:hypothetical protein